MFLVEDQRSGASFFVFTWEDPRKAGYAGSVTENVTLDYDEEEAHDWPDGQPSPEACLGRKKDDAKHFKVFKYQQDCLSAGYEPMAGTFVVVGSWADYLQLSFHAPRPEVGTDEQWLDLFDEIDAASRERRRKLAIGTQPASANRDDVAAWVAKEHLAVDSAISQILYLPQGAPPNEIRLLELNDRLAGSESKVEPIDFGLDIEGADFRLVVADVTSDQLEEVKKDPSRLPPGWSLDGNRIWGRRGA